MRLFHASNQVINKPEVKYSRDYLDFGKGFYLTSLYEQAERYAQRFIRREQEAWINVYELCLSEEQWRVLYFDKYNADWLRFVTACRAGRDSSEMDLIVGGVANDRVIKTIELYFAGEMTEEHALGLLAFEHPNNQYCIRNQSMLDQCLIYKESIKL